MGVLVRDVPGRRGGVWGWVVNKDAEFLSQDHSISLDEAIRIINSELQWCYQNQPPSVNDDFRTGFIMGLKQAVYLLVALAKNDKGGKHFYNRVMAVLIKRQSQSEKYAEMASTFGREFVELIRMWDLPAISVADAEEYYKDNE